MIHSSWVIRHVIEMEEAGVTLQDPFVGYLAAIAASIQLEHTINKNVKMANVAWRKYERARDYVERLSKKWPNMRNTVRFRNSPPCHSW